MSLLDTILNAGGGATVQQLSSQFGLGPSQTTSALGALVPALAAGLQKNAQSDGGLGDLLSALSGGQHQRYLNDPAALGDPATIDDGNKILGHVLGSKDVSRQVASQAAAQTGVGADVLKKMLPMAATLLMGALANQTTSAAPASGMAPAAGGGADLLSLLGGTVGAQSEGSSMLGMLGKFLGR